MKQLDADTSLTKRVLATLHNSIISGELAPGQLYSVGKLSEVLAVSRTPVREACITLAEQGMLKFERNRGVRILQTTVHDLEEIFSIRLLLEVPAVYRAVLHKSAVLPPRLKKELVAMERAALNDDEALFMKSDRRFHLVLLEASGNLRLASYVDSLRDMVSLRGASTVRRSRSLPDIIAEHVPILEWVERGDAHRAADEMRRHILHTSSLLIGQESVSGLVGSGKSFDWYPHPKLEPGDVESNHVADSK